MTSPYLSPELAYVTARYAAVAPYRKVAALLSELLPVDGTQHVSTVCNRTLRVNAQVVQSPHPTPIASAPHQSACSRHFRPHRHLMTASVYRHVHAEALRDWQNEFCNQVGWVSRPYDTPATG